MASSNEPLVHAAFLRCMAAIYLFAFVSLYTQIPGLYGKNGILPAHRLLEDDQRAPSERFREKPTVLWFLPSYLGLDTERGMDFICLAGSLLSLGSLLCQSMRCTAVYFFLWFGYLSLYQVGQTFLWFQWDILLLETGFLTVLLAPVFSTRCKVGTSSNSAIAMWLIKWLLFRLMFASGIVKLTSHCPTWWGLTALDYHFESQCIPTPAAWYFHHSPEWFRRLSVVATYFIEIPVPFLFFAPIRSLRLFAFFCQVLFQGLIITTGNYNFFNLLTVVLCLSLVDDRFLLSFVPGAKQGVYRPTSLCLLEKLSTSFAPVHKFFRRFVAISVVSLLLYYTGVYFDIRLNTSKSLLETNVAFSKADFESALRWWMPVTIAIAVASFVIEVISGLVSALQLRGICSKCWSVLQLVLFTTIATRLFASSLVPHTVLDYDLQGRLWPAIHRWHQETDFLHMTSSYGLFRRMTGVGGRPEVVIEGSNDLTTGWKEYDFLYKPGNVSVGPPIVAPHQPRLDWQMWFAALGNYQHNPWLVSLTYKLLLGQKEVLDLMGENPFPKKPPMFVRSRLYHYHFTKPKTDGTVKQWWRRTLQDEYIPPVKRDEPTVHAFLKHHNLFNAQDRSASRQPGHLSAALHSVRRYARHHSAGRLMLALAVAVLALEITKWFVTKSASMPGKTRLISTESRSLKSVKGERAQRHRPYHHHHRTMQDRPSTVSD